MDRNIAKDSTFLLQPPDRYLVLGATVSGEDLVLLEPDYFANAHAGIDTEAEKELVTRGIEGLEAGLDPFRTRNLCRPAMSGPGS